MEVLYPRCAGLDVHQLSVVACVRIANGARASHEVRTFETTTKGLLALADWLREGGCTHVAMESTGVYWKPVWHVLEGDFELVLANATHIRNVPGRKTDVNDATWIADLLAHGLIRGSFVPPAEVQELRDLTRTRKQLVRELARHTQRIQKTLEDANIKIVGVISDILGTSGRGFLEAIIAGEDDPQRLADLARGRLKADREKIVEALRGRVQAHHRFMLKLHLEQIRSLEKAIAEIEGRLGERLEPFREEVGLPLKKGRAQTLTHDYKRHGTTTLFAALNTLGGMVISQCMPRHRHQEWLRFLRQIDRETPPALKLHLIADNYATHKHPRVQAWLAKHPRFHMHFTPTSASWLNMVERFFRDLTDKQLSRGVFHSVAELIAAIERYIAQHNRNPKPFIWTARASDILAKVAKARAKLNKFQSV